MAAFTRPRWHDAVIAAAITGLLALGVWALWWDDVRGWLDLAPREQPVTPAVAAPRGT